MSGSRPLADAAARVLAADARRVREPSPTARAQAVEAVVRAMRSRKRRVRLRRAAIGAAAAAACVAAAVGFGRSARTDDVVAGVEPRPVPFAAAALVRGAPVLVRAAARTSLTDGAVLEPGDRVVADPGSRATIALASGTHVTVEQRSELALVSAAPSTVFELASGSVRADVAKVLPGERFLIRTPDAEVEVRGTSFDVERVEPDTRCGGGTTTRVRVREGLVVVRAHRTEVLVHANEIWPTCASAPASRMTPAPASGEPERAAPAVDASSAQPGPLRSAPRATTATSQPPAQSDLAAQNDLFELAVARRRARDLAGAVAGFEQLLTRYPKSHLAQSARAERMKLLLAVDEERARAAARDYLARYPNGFARVDAERILTPSP